jgi:hypothetical protein
VALEEGEAMIYCLADVGPEGYDQVVFVDFQDIDEGDVNEFLGAFSTRIWEQLAWIEEYTGDIPELYNWPDMFEPSDFVNASSGYVDDETLDGIPVHMLVKMRESFRESSDTRPDRALELFIRAVAARVQGGGYVGVA